MVTNYSYADAPGGHKTALDGTELWGVTSDPSGTPADVYITPEDVRNYMTWIPVAAAWTRTGNHAFTVATDLTAVYRVGTKVRYQDGGGTDEYGTVISSSYSAPNTTVTLATNTDYVMAAATITNRYISYIENPDGWPDVFNYTPTVGGAITLGNGTVSGKFKITGETIKWWASFVQGSTGGMGSGAATVSNPATLAAPVDAYIGRVILLDTGTANHPAAAVISTSGASCFLLGAGGTYLGYATFTASAPFTWAEGDALSVEGEGILA